METQRHITYCSVNDKLMLQLIFLLRHYQLKVVNYKRNGKKGKMRQLNFPDNAKNLENFQS